MRKAALLFALGNVLWMAACGSSGGGGGGTVTSINVSCSPSTVTSGGTSQCSATVSGTGNFSTAVRWSASAGTIAVEPENPSVGFFTAPMTDATLLVTITATSGQNTNVSGTATITVNPAGMGSNVQPITVDQGPEPQTFLATNQAFTTVTICVPGTNTCQNIDHVQVDTGSQGLRLLSSASGGELGIALPQENDSSGNPLDECLVFADGYVWGMVATADIGMAGETASSIPVQVIIPPSSSPAVPTACSNRNPPGGTGNEGGSVMMLGANGILGVGLFQQDCGLACTPGFQTQPMYFACPSGSCTAINIPVTQQVTNPVIMFATDNNGVLIQFPAVPDGGSLTVAGSLIFGIGTESNNSLGSATVYGANDSGNFTTIFNGTTYPNSFIDSGSNGYFFPSNIPTCANPNQHWYCPSTSPDNLSAQNQGTNMSSPITVNFSLEDASTLFNSSNTAFSTLGGPLPANLDAFDWGLPFFYGRNVFTAIQGQNAPGGTPPPYFAY
ncbi:MAG TPA: DUF3443 domain-containing protein [Candidatus Binatia bacterium]|nr:DUF3443 domain-containing protein [Candidatus Binatia bacterium]